MDLSSFDRENIIFSDKPNASVLAYYDTHGFTPEILMTKKNVIGMYQNSTINGKKELILEYICKVQGMYYIYLTFDTSIKQEEGDNYKMRLYYDYNDRQQINLLLTSLKK